MSGQTSDSIYIPRLAEALLRAFLARAEPHRPVLLVEGARQVGKTRLVAEVLRGCGERVVALNLERDALALARIDACREFAEFAELMVDDYGFVGTDGAVLFVDEAQESRQLGGFVRFMKESWPRASVVLSGSSLSRLFRADQRYPVGRVERLVVTPFAFSEWLLAHGQAGLAEAVAGDPAALSPARHERLLGWYDQFLQTGGMPEAVLAHAGGGDHRLVLARLAADYQQDFARLFAEEDLDLVQACLRAVANLAGSPFKNTSVVAGATTRVNERINAILARLEAWHLVLRAEQQGPAATAAPRHLPKRYLFDTGLLRHLREAAVPAIGLLDTTPGLRDVLGGVLENQLAVDLARGQQALVGWKQSSAGNEIDFVCRLPDGQQVPVECKATLRADGRHLRGLRAYLDRYPVEVGLLASCAPAQITRFDDGKRVAWRPLYCMERLGLSSTTGQDPQALPGQ